MSVFIFFFFQAEDGIRDYKVTGVQTCALPISWFDGHTSYRGNRSEALIIIDLVVQSVMLGLVALLFLKISFEIGRASCRERVYISVVAVVLKKIKGDTTG